jgi:hypothetical protein
VTTQDRDRRDERPPPPRRWLTSFPLRRLSVPYTGLPRRSTKTVTRVYVDYSNVGVVKAGDHLTTRLLAQ